MEAVQGEFETSYLEGTGELTGLIFLNAEPTLKPTGTQANTVNTIRPSDSFVRKDVGGQSVFEERQASNHDFGVVKSKSTKGPPISIAVRKLEARVALAFVIIPFIGVISAIILLWGHGIGVVEVSLLCGMFAVTAIGVEVGFHRFLTHRAFETGPTVRALLAIFGSMAAQGSPIYWAAIHRRHHQHSDQPGDPHSPHLHGTGIRGVLWGFWHAHVGWLFEPETTDRMRLVPDLFRDKVVFKLSQFYLVWLVLGLLIPAILGGILARTWTGVFYGFLWGGLVRIFLLQHTIWSTNSICHLYGSRPFECHDKSTNNIWLSLISFGQSWHNNHHAFPSSAINKLRWWQIDLGGFTIRALEFLGLAWNIRIPPSQNTADTYRTLTGPEPSSEVREFSGKAEHDRQST